MGKQVNGRSAKRKALQAQVFHRAMVVQDIDRDGVSRLFDAIAAPDGRLRCFFGAGTTAAAFAPDGADGAALPEEFRDISDACMVTLREAGPIALRSGAQITPNITPAEYELLQGRNVTFGFRIAETAGQMAEALRYHAQFHGLQGALIINRLPDPQAPEALSEALRVALGDCAITVVLLDCPAPLGKPGLGPETHPYLAPDAPGKDRMTPPEPDPWRAPLAEQILYELAKWRFLAQARAVLHLDLADILAPQSDPEAPSAFDACLSAKHGVVVLLGQRIYPWRVRPKGRLQGEARFGDHICQQFDAKRGIIRWGVAPEKAGLANTWRAMRVSYAKADTAALPFYRAMAIKVPGRNSGELAPKTSLIEAPELLALSEVAFHHSPIRAPISAQKLAPEPALEAGRTAIVTTMKNEGPFILEWIAYHRAIGVDDFLIYTNDCTDGTDTMLELLQAKGLVQHRANPWQPGGELKPQHAALQAAEAEPVMQNAGWGICMDVDEFINIKIGDGTLAALYAAMGDANMISLTWRLIGNSDVDGYEDRHLLAQFTQCAPEVIRKPHQAWGFKTLFRNIDIYKKLGVHRPKGLRPDLWDQVRWLNGSGQAMPRATFRNGWRSTLETYGYDWVQLNHYAVRSAESFLVKRDRGRVNHVDRDQGLNYWFRMNHNVDQDRSIQRMIPAMQREFDRLLADPEIRAAHDHAVACHRAKIAELLETDNYRNFHGELTSARMRALCKMQHHFGSAVFSAGPGVIPEDLHLRDLPRDFFFTIDHDGEAEH